MNLTKNEYAGKKVLIAGGRSGFIGTNFAKKLLDLGAEVTVHGKTLSKKSNFEQEVSESIEDLSKHATIPDNTDCVIHCAAHTSGAKEMIEDPEAQIHVNASINSNILEASARAGVKKFLFISSSAMYPLKDDELKEEDGFTGDPPSCYFGPAWMKRYAEKIAEFYANHMGMEVLIIRPSNIFGPYSSFDLEYSHVLPALIRKFVEKQDPIEVWGNPNVLRDFIYVDDFTRISLDLFNRLSGFGVFNVASGKQYSIREVVDTIKTATNYQGDIIFDSKKPMTVSSRAISTKKCDDIGLKTNVTFQDGILETIDWYIGALRGVKRRQKN